MPERPHLFFIAPTAYPLGGVAVWLDYLMRGLKATDVKVTFGAVDGHFHNADAYLQHYPFSDVVKIEYRTGSVYSRMRSLAKAIEMVKPTLLVCVSIPDAYLATRYLRASGKGKYKLITTIHALMPNVFGDLDEYSDVIDHVIVTNLLTRLMVGSRTKFTAQQVHYAQYGVELEATSPVPPSSVPEAMKILYCGRIDMPQKRCQDISKIIRAIHNSGCKYELLIAGDGPYKSTMLGEMADLNVRDLGVLRADEVVAKAYQQANALLLTSDWETGPIVVWEAMAHGLPVVTSNYKGLVSEAALIHHQNCLVFEVADTATAAAHLLELRDIRTYSKLIQGGYALVKERYSRAASLTAWSACFEQISNDHPEPFKGKSLPVKLRPRGRLEQMLGQPLADLLRRVFGKTVYINGAGDEWPHTHTVFGPKEVSNFEEQIQYIEIANSGEGS